MNAAETAEPRLADVLQSLRESGVIIRREAEIIAYLVKYRHILEFLTPLAEALLRAFPQNALLLDYYISREDVEDASPVLIVCQTAANQVQVEELLKFYEEHDHLLSFRDGWVGVITAFCNPKTGV